MHSISCPSCDTVSSMKFVREEARYGFCYSLSLQCTDCDAVASKTFSSQRAATPQPSKPFIVNELIVLFFNQIGHGHSAMKKFCLTVWLARPASHNISWEGGKDHQHHHQQYCRRLEGKHCQGEGVIPSN